MSLTPTKLLLTVLPAEKRDALKNAAEERCAAEHAFVRKFFATLPRRSTNAHPIASYLSRCFDTFAPMLCRERAPLTVVRRVSRGFNQFKVAYSVIGRISILVMNVMLGRYGAAVITPNVAVHVVTIRQSRVGAVITDTYRTLVVAPALEFLHWINSWSAHVHIVQEGRA